MDFQFPLGSAEWALPRKKSILADAECLVRVVNTFSGLFGPSDSTAVCQQTRASHAAKQRVVAEGRLPVWGHVPIEATIYPSNVSPNEQGLH